MWGWPDAEEALRAQARAGSYQAASGRSGAAGRKVTAAAVVCAFNTFRPLGLVTRLYVAAAEPRCSREHHERCAATTTTTATARVDLGRSRCARVGVGPCRMARLVLKDCGLWGRSAGRAPGSKSQAAHDVQ